jgi:starch-binding outer membrane protein, SusD/RagB family
MRAFTYANLLWRYGSAGLGEGLGIPIINKDFALSDTVFPVTRAAYNTCVDSILLDIDRAIALLLIRFRKISEDALRPMLQEH